MLVMEGRRKNICVLWIIHYEFVFMLRVYKILVFIKLYTHACQVFFLFENKCVLKSYLTLFLVSSYSHTHNVKYVQDIRYVDTSQRIEYIHAYMMFGVPYLYSVHAVDLDLNEELTRAHIL